MRMISLRTAAALIAILAPALPARAETVLRMAMTLSDIPLTTGQPSQGGEGGRATGTTMYEGLLRWHMPGDGTPARLVPGLAESWTIDDTKTVWTLKLRKGVRFHDGSTFNADAVVWNLDKIMDRKSKQFDTPQATQAASYVASVKSYRRIDDETVEIVTKEPDSTFAYRLVQILFSSPARWAELGGDWGKFSRQPSGTGPWKFDKLVPRERIEMVRNADYWNAERIPKTDRLVLLTMPDANTRVAALLSGQVDVIEAVAPDTVPRLRQAGMQVVANESPNILHVWPYWLSYAEGSPFRDIRVRKAINLAIDREGLSKFLGGYAMPASGMVPPGHPFYGKPNFKIGYDPAGAKKLLAEAGYGAAKPLKLRFIISPSGSGQMQPLPMNEFVQENLREIGVDLSFDVMDWEALRGRRRSGADGADNKGSHAINNSWNIADPDMGLLSTSASHMRPPLGNNWGLFSDARTDELVKAAKSEFEPAKLAEALGSLHAHLVDQAMWIWVVHDLAPKGLSKRVKGFVPGHNSYQDLSPVTVD
ncbi:MAG: ABC transporter substrate-binding protein [Beijerinckiaceae bacterium]|nr:ABC transporter substrate-binding protein [Beijerinckiaceae bacterium]